MQLNACTTTALRILAACAEQTEAPCTMPGMAETLAVGEALVVKACHQLMRAGYIAGTRGRGGGYRLARPAADITLLEIVRLFEAEDDLFPCRLLVDGPCRIAPVCRLRLVCAEAWAAYAAELTATTVADIVETPVAA